MSYRFMVMIVVATSCFLTPSPTTAQKKGYDAETRRRLEAFQPNIDAAIDKGVAYILGRQLADGSWEYMKDAYPTGQTALCVYTLLKAGLPADHPAVARGLASMLRRRPTETYAAGCQLLALEATGETKYREKMGPIVKDLIKWQDGSWSYPHGHAANGWSDGKGTLDLSNTQYAALGLRAGRFAGYDVPRRVWTKLVADVMKYQEKVRQRPVPDGTGRRGVGGFHYWQSGPTPGVTATGSMTSAGIAVLKICRDGFEPKLSKSQAKKIDRAIAEGLAWLGVNFDVERNPGLTPGQWGPEGKWLFIYYYLYGLERVGSFLEIDWIDDHPWYLEGARRLVGIQNSEGWWEDMHKTPDTCFGVLFLKRASFGGATTGEGKVKPRNYVLEGPDTPVRLKAQGRTELVIWVTGFSDEVLKMHAASDLGGVRVAKVEYLCDGKVIAHQDGKPGQGWKGDQYAVRHQFAESGDYEIRARVHLVAADASVEAKTTDVTIESSAMTVQVEDVVESWMTELATADDRNLLTNKKIKSKLKVKASSAANQKPAAAAVDGRFETHWVTKRSDREPSIKITSKRSIKANTIILMQAARRAEERFDFDRITRAEIHIKGVKEPIVVTPHENTLRPIIVTLPKTTNIKQVEIKITGRARGQKMEGQIGLSEIMFEQR